MNAKPQVSVVIIFFNAEVFLEEAIRSVVAQSYQSWELLLVDDGSTDQSTAIARGYAREYPGRMFYLEHDNHQNRGMSASRNLGVQQARGQYIAILDADDVWAPQTLEEQVSILGRHPEAALVYGRVQRWHSWTGNPEDLHRDSLRDLGVPADTIVNPPVQFNLLVQDKGMPSGFMVRREVLKRVGGYEETFRGMYEDNALLAKVCLRYPVFASGKSWYRYRKHPDAACAVAVKTGQYPLARLAFLNWVAQYLTREGVEDPLIRQTLREELRLLRHPLWHDLISHTRQLVRYTRGLLRHAAGTRSLAPSSRTGSEPPDQKKLVSK
jgi:glycosyltransferase involved in cell wall biosynthesis